MDFLITISDGDKTITGEPYGLQLMSNGSRMTIKTQEGVKAIPIPEGWTFKNGRWLPSWLT